MSGEPERVADPLTHAEAEFRRRLAAIGCTVHSAERTELKGGRGRLTIEFAGRDDRGHACETRIRFDSAQDANAENLQLRIDKAMRAQERFHEAAGGIAPVVPGPGMPLSHLLVSMPYARRLRLDHGAGAQDALRAHIVARLAETAKAPSSAVPNKPAFSGNRIDHREEFAPGVALRASHIVVADTTLPDSVAMSLVGRPATALCEHPVLGETETIAAIEMTNVDCALGRRTVVAKLHAGWIRADEI